MKACTECEDTASCLTDLSTTVVSEQLHAPATSHRGIKILYIFTTRRYICTVV